MKDRNVWTLMPRLQVSPNRQCIKCKWVLKIKRKGIFDARLVACRYSQIPGVYYTKSYTPVVNDITFRVLIIVLILFNLSNTIIDMETAFLHRELEEDMYMNAPKGLIHNGINVQEKKEICCSLN